MALFESYERRIDKINEVLNSYGIASLEEMPDWTFTIRSKEFSRSVSRTHAGLTSQVQRSRSRKTAETQQTQLQRSEKAFRLSVFRDLLLISVR